MTVLDNEKLGWLGEPLQQNVSTDAQRIRQPLLFGSSLVDRICNSNAIFASGRKEQFYIIQIDCGYSVERSFTCIDAATDFTPNVKLTPRSSMNTPSSQIVKLKIRQSNIWNESRYQVFSRDIVSRLKLKIWGTNKGKHDNDDDNGLPLVRMKGNINRMLQNTEYHVCDTAAPTWRYSADCLHTLKTGFTDMRFGYEYIGQTVMMYINDDSVLFKMGHDWCCYVIKNSYRALDDTDLLAIEPCEVSLKYRLVEVPRRPLDLCLPQWGMSLTNILPCVTESIPFIESPWKTWFYYLEQAGPLKTDNLTKDILERIHDYVQGNNKKRGVDRNSIERSKDYGVQDYGRYGVQRFLTISKHVDISDVLILSTIIVKMYTRSKIDVHLWTMLETIYTKYRSNRTDNWKCDFRPGVVSIFSTSNLNNESCHILQTINKQHKRSTKDVHVKTNDTLLATYRENEYSLTMQYLSNMLDTIEYQERQDATIKHNLYDENRKTKKYKASYTNTGVRNVNVIQSVACIKDEYEATTSNDSDGGNFDGDSENNDSKTDVSNESLCSHKLQELNSINIEPNKMEMIDDYTEPRQDHNSINESSIDLASQNVSSNDSSANGQNVDIVMESVPNRNIDQISNTHTGGCTLVQHTLNAACRETHSAHVIDEMESTNNNNDVTNHNRDDCNENESDDSLLDQTNESGISQDDYNNDNMARALQDELNIQDRAGFEHHLEYVDIRNPNADPPNHQYDSLVSITDSGFGSEHGRRGNVISDLNSVRNGRRVTRQNCPICRYRRTHGNMPRDQQLALYVPDEEGDTSLMLAITFTEIHLAKCLIEQAPSPQHLDIQNRYYLLTALHHAVIAERSDIIRYLLAHGADPTVKDKDGNTALHIACALATNENIILIKALTVSLSCGLENFRYAHLHAIPQETTLFNYGGETVLHRAAEKGNTRAINFLIGPYFRINLNLQEATAGYTILHNAIIQTNRDLINHLLTLSDIDIEAETFAGQTPLELAEVYDLRDIVAMLIAYGARIRNVKVSDSADNDENLCQQPSSIPELVDAHREYGEVNSESTIKEQEVCSTGNVSSTIPNTTTLTQADSIVDISHSVKHTDTKTKTDHQAPKNGEQTTDVLDILHEEESEHTLATSFDVHQNSVMECLNDRQGDALSKSGNVVACNTPTHSTTHACEEEGNYDEDRDMLLISGMSVALRGQYDFW